MNIIVESSKHLETRKNIFWWMFLNVQNNQKQKNSITSEQQIVTEEEKWSLFSGGEEKMNRFSASRQKLSGD